MMTVIASPVCVAGPVRSPDAGRVAESTVSAHAPRSLLPGLRISRAGAGCGARPLPDRNIFLGRPADQAISWRRKPPARAINAYRRRD